MKKAVFFLSPFCGGAERMTITIAKLLDRSEYDVRFVVIGTQVGEIKSFVPEDYSLSLIRIRNIYDFTTLRILRFLKDVQPQYVFCSLMYLNPRVIQAAKWVGNCKIIVRFNCEVNRVKGITKYLTQRTYPKADLVIAQTEKMQEDLEQAYHLAKGKVVTMHNLIDRDTILQKLEHAENPYLNEGNKVLVWVGRFDRVKCLEDAVKAFIKAFKKDRKISFYVIAKYSETNEYYLEVKSLLQGIEANNNVHFVGFQDNPYKWMKFADGLVLSSRSEGSPNVLFEALSLGVPAVATRCTPNIDGILEDGVNGFKVNVGDVEAMAEGMVKVTKLKDVKTIYSHSTPDDFLALFKN